MTGKLTIQKASGGVLNITPADGATSTDLVLPLSGTVVATDVSVSDNAIARYDGTTGKVQNSGVIIDDSNKISINDAANGGAIYLSGKTGTSNDAQFTVRDANRLDIEYNGAKRVSIDANGNLLLTSGTGGLGYGTGAGGTVTQLTSKSTSVTLNKPSGYITMNNAALAAGATASFIVFNSLAGIGSVVLSGIQGTDNYSVETRSNFNNGFSVYVTNKTAGTLGDPVQIQFILLKGATA